jgi:hypothetical protein
MNLSFENIIISTLYLVGGIYSLLTGILALAKRDIRLPGFYRLGVFLTKIIQGEDKVTSFETDMRDRKKVIRYGIFWILIGFAFLAGAVFVLFAA